jgi:hypothetical protein
MEYKIEEYDDKLSTAQLKLLLEGEAKRNWECFSVVYASGIFGTSGKYRAFFKRMDDGWFAREVNKIIQGE